MSTFRLVRSAAAVIQLPDLVVPSNPTAWVCVALMAVATVVAVLRTRAGRLSPLWLTIVYVVLLLVGFLAWASAGATLPMIGLLTGSLALATPLIFGALGGVIGERVGVVNIAIEAQLLSGAFSAALVGSLTGTPWLGLVAAMIAGLLVGLVLAVFAITYFVNQIIVGVVLNVLVVGLTTFFFSTVMADNTATLNSPELFRVVSIPVLSEIPVIGPVLFQQTVLIYLMYIVVAVVWYGLYHTRWGPAPARRGRAPAGRRHRGHQGRGDPVRQRHARGRDRGHGRRVLHARVEPSVRTRDDGRRRIHRARRAHLR